jgi:hypothetical protein
MRELRISEMLIVSEKEKGGRRVEFDPKLTVIEGGNDTGKSALIKSIYWAFGANPVHMTARWKSATPTVVVKSTVDGEPLTVLRKGRYFAAYGDDDQLLAQFDSVTNELGPFLAERLAFGLTLPSQQGKPVVPPPAYMFMPFYIDQDASWQRQWSAFTNLGQLPAWQRPLMEYHTGIRDQRWYLLLQRILDAKKEIGEEQSELAVIRRMRERALQEGAPLSFDVDLSDFREEIDELLRRCEVLKGVEEDLKVRYSALAHERHTLAEQVKTVTLAAAELGADRAFVATTLHDDSVECPTCGAEYSNSFRERFAIADDEARLVDFLVELTESLGGIDRQIDEMRNEFSMNKEEALHVREVLESRQAEVSLAAIIQNEGRKEFRGLLKSESDAGVLAVHAAETNLKALEKRKRALNKELKARRDEVEEAHARQMRRYLHRLNVLTQDETAWANVASRISDSGSGLPRSLMAYYYSILGLVRQHSGAFFAPIVIDEPNQQGQDDVNMKALLQFIVDELPNGSQAVLGVESDHGVELPGTRLRLRDKLGVLDKEQYVVVRDEVAAYLDRALAG